MPPISEPLSTRSHLLKVPVSTIMFYAYISLYTYTLYIYIYSTYYIYIHMYYIYNSIFVYIVIYMYISSDVISTVKTKSVSNGN